MRLTARRTQAYAWLLLNTLTWGASIPIIKWGLGETSPLRFLLYRFAIAALISIPVIWHYRKEFLRHTHKLLPTIGVELIGTTLGLGILYTGLNLTTSLETNLIITTGPVFITIGGIIFFHDKVTKREWFGLSLASSMTIVLTLLPFLALGIVMALSSGNLIGNLLVLSQVFSGVAFTLLAKKVYHQMPKLLATCMSSFVGLVSFSLLSFWEVSFDFSRLTQTISQELSNPTVWFIALFAGVITTYIGLTAFFKGQDLIEVSEASLFVYLQPLVYIPISFFLLGESLSQLQIICFIFVIVGVILAEWKPSRRAFQKARHR